MSEQVPDPTPRGAVVVAVDGSEAADRALAWAARHADRENRPLVLAHAFRIVGAPESVGLHFDSGAAFAHVYEQLHAAGEAILADASAKVSVPYPSLEVHAVLDGGDARQ